MARERWEISEDGSEFLRIQEIHRIRDGSLQFSDEDGTLPEEQVKEIILLICNFVFSRKPEPINIIVSTTTPYDEKKYKKPKERQYVVEKAKKLGYRVTTTEEWHKGKYYDFYFSLPDQSFDCIAGYISNTKDAALSDIEKILGLLEELGFNSFYINSDYDTLCFSWGNTFNPGKIDLSVSLNINILSTPGGQDEGEFDLLAAVKGEKKYSEKFFLNLYAECEADAENERRRDEEEWEKKSQKAKDREQDLYNWFHECREILEELEPKLLKYYPCPDCQKSCSPCPDQLKKPSKKYVRRGRNDGMDEPWFWVTSENVKCRVQIKQKERQFFISLYMENSQETLFDVLYAGYKTELEKKLGNLNWERSVTKKVSMIEMEVLEDVHDTDNVADKTKHFIEVLQPILKELNLMPKDYNRRNS